MRAAICFVAALLLGASVTPLPVSAQSMGQIVSPVLTIDREALFEKTLFGQRVRADLEAESTALADETRGIEAALEEEERRLTEQRATLSPEEFRNLADEFDDRVVALRQDRDRAQANFVQRFETAQREFYNEIIPLLGEMMRERRAVVIMDSRSVLLSVNAIDVTDEAIALIDGRLGDGSPLAAPDTLDGPGAEDTIPAPSTSE